MIEPNLVEPKTIGGLTRKPTKNEFFAEIYEFSDHNLRDILQNITDDYHVGAADEIRPFPRRKNFYQIINTDTRRKGGVHWVAFAQHNMRGYFFDPLGKPLSAYNKLWSHIVPENFKQIKVQKQKDRTVTCGSWCLHFIDSLITDSKMKNNRIAMLNKMYTRFPREYEKLYSNNIK